MGILRPGSIRFQLLNIKLVSQPCSDSPHKAPGLNSLGFLSLVHTEPYFLFLHPISFYFCLFFHKLTLLLISDNFQTFHSTFAYILLEQSSPGVFGSFQFPTLKIFIKTFILIGHKHRSVFTYPSVFLHSLSFGTLK